MQSHSATERLDAVIEHAVSSDSIVGAVVLVSIDGQTVYERAAGWADREAGRAMQKDLIFRLASVTKPIVSVAAMRLVELGMLELDDPVTRYLPDFRPRLEDGTEPVITVHHLLSHTSGLGYGFLMPPDSQYHRLYVSDGLDQPGLGMLANLTRLNAAQLLFPPGQQWSYSLSLDVLGAVMEGATGVALPMIVKEHVTDPLGMTDTGFALQDASRLAKPYVDASPKPLEMRDGAAVPLEAPGFQGSVRFAPGRILNPNSYPSGGAGMAGTAMEMLRLIEAIRQGGSGILNPETVKLMLHDHLGPHVQTQGPGWGFGYGWAVLSDGSRSVGPQAEGTIQWGGVYGHTWFMDPVNKLSVVALTNTAFEGMSGRFPEDIRNAIYGWAPRATF